MSGANKEMNYEFLVSKLIEAFSERDWSKILDLIEIYSEFELWSTKGRSI